MDGASAKDRTRNLPPSGGWEAEYAELSTRDRQTALEPAELERLAMVAYLVGRDAESIETLTRAHNSSLERGDTLRAARAAFWVAFASIGVGERTRAAGWVARARRLLDEDRHDCVERGFVMLPTALEQVATGDMPGAESTFAAAERIGERFGDPDLIGLARQGRGRALVALGRMAEGVPLFDEVMVAVTAGELSPIVAGVVYCSVISACFDIFDVRRAQEWTDALNDWCAAQPGLVPYRGECLAHRADVLRFRGRWAEALVEARRAYDALAAAKRPAQGTAMYALAELHRLHGDAATAEEAYRVASEHGRTPHPGLALLRLAQGEHEVARASIVRAMAEPTRGRQRADLLAAAVEILLVSDDAAAARPAADELRGIAAAYNSPCLRAMSLLADGAVSLAGGDAQSALVPLRDAWTLSCDLETPYEAARARVLIGMACRQLGDADGAHMEWEAAARVFREFGAAPDLARVQALHDVPSTTPGGLTSREAEVLRLVARGKTNRAIARDLSISEKTVARHVSNIFTKLDLSTRAAATAYAFRHHLVD